MVAHGQKWLLQFNAMISEIFFVKNEIGISIDIIN
jgi:hypothetical protein